ncbi:uncharacterized protein LACBIDRAFT_303112 [Laccaria bicolor S238N-H82]|uniref:Predicted protein n=1 Tax=Laccaria bicolor (strain S238N-H82 / ATCC MYA-4686) TaxID=486041 RepID=B0DIY6_LACBS|nr:uncharacterized protein LACBIDRAFT_303112 [Laccaria bicolor S238N-H82]EDR05315.1 predicted protein [Laccaria bicolor S238N-H82]|eukprot:XP_001883873.1 predicted protein [Laccaria bicolor S238N-H82]
MKNRGRRSISLHIVQNAKNVRYSCPRLACCEWRNVRNGTKYGKQCARHNLSLTELTGISAMDLEGGGYHSFSKYTSRYVSCAWTKTIHCEWRKLGSVLEILRYRLGGVLKGTLTRRIVSLTKVFQARS